MSEKEDSFIVHYGDKKITGAPAAAIIFGFLGLIFLAGYATGIS